MGIFRTQFERKNVLTHVTVEELENHTFGCMINLEVDFDPSYLPTSLPYYDIIIQQTSPGVWKKTGEQKEELGDKDIQNLGKAIEVDKTIKLKDSGEYLP